MSSSTDHFLARMINLYPYVGDVHSVLPRRWHSASKDKNLLLSKKSLCVHYNGPGKSTKEAGTVRADAPIPPACGVYYFEIKVVDKGRSGYIGIGLNRGATFKSNRLPGWDKDSYGYHGDDGQAFLSNTTGAPYGPTFGSEDVVGCGINFVDRCIFFTKNGVCLGAPFCDVPMSDNFYPVVGLQTQGEIVEANFGQQEFEFGIEEYMASARKKVREGVAQFAVENSHGQWNRVVDSLVMSYLSHHGFAASAESLSKSSRVPLAEEPEETRQRQSLVRKVLDGEMDDVLETLEREKPSLLERRPELHYQLKVQQFIELLRNQNSRCGDHARHLEKVFVLGRELHALQSVHGLKKELFTDAVSLLAYKDPSKSELKHLLLPSQRKPSSEALNAALLAEKGHPDVPPLERALAQTARCLQALLHHTADGGPAFLQEDFQRPLQEHEEMESDDVCELEAPSLTHKQPITAALLQQPITELH